MTEKIMNNVKEKFSKSREVCEGMSERLYLLADYISETAPNTVNPTTLVICLENAIRNLSEERRWTKIVKNKDLRGELYLMAKKVKNQAVNIPQIIDVIADEAFADEFRELCKERLGFNPPKYGSGSKELMDYPEYVRIAANWWAIAIFYPKLDTPEAAVSSSLAKIIEEEVGVKSYSKEEVLAFVTTLADEIMEDLNAWGICVVSVDYDPCEALKTAGKKIGISPIFGYPLKTSMAINKYQVEVISGDYIKKILWTK